MGYPGRAIQLCFRAGDEFCHPRHALLDEYQTAELKNRMETVSRETPESRNTGGKAAV